MKKLLLLTCLSLFVYADNDKIALSIYSKAYSKELKSKAKEVEEIIHNLLPREIIKYIPAKNTLLGIRKFYKGVKPTAKYLYKKFELKSNFRKWLKSKNVDYLMIIGIKISKKKHVLFYRFFPVGNAKKDEKFIKAKTWKEMRSLLIKSLQETNLIRFASLRAKELKQKRGWFNEEMPLGIKKGKRPGSYIWKKDSSAMVYVPAGEFSNETTKENIRSFYIDKYETSNLQFCTFLNQIKNTENIEFYIDLKSKHCLIEKKEGKFYPKKNAAHFPVIEVSWPGAKDYSEWAKKSLPTSLEWKKTLQGGTKIPSQNKNSLIKNENKTRVFPWGKTLPNEHLYRCNYYQKIEADGYAWLAPVITFDGIGDSPYACSNLVGNVWEWCNDQEDGLNICRGGSWSSDLEILKNPVIQVPQDTTNNEIGFRTILRQ